MLDLNDDHQIDHAREPVLAVLKVVNLTIVDDEIQSFEFTEEKRLVTVGRATTTDNLDQPFLSIQFNSTVIESEVKTRGRKKKPAPQPKDVCISKKHCSVMFDPISKSFVLLNYGKNGCYINDTLLVSNVGDVSSVAQLKHNDTIRLANARSPVYLQLDIVDEELRDLIGTRLM